MFDTKIAIVVRDDLLVWQKLNVTAFLTSGVLGGNASLLGEPYEDAGGVLYTPLIVQPMIVLTTDGAGLTRIHQRALERRVRLAQRMAQRPLDEDHARHAHRLRQVTRDRDADGRNAGGFQRTCDQSHGPIAEPSSRREKGEVDAIGA